MPVLDEVIEYKSMFTSKRICESFSVKFHVMLIHIVTVIQISEERVLSPSNLATKNVKILP